MQCHFCPETIDEAKPFTDPAAQREHSAELSKWRQLTLTVQDGGAVCLLVAHACPRELLIPGMFVLAHKVALDASLRRELRDAPVKPLGYTLPDASAKPLEYRAPTPTWEPPGWELAAPEPVDVMGAIAALEREDDVYALIRRWAKHREARALLETVVASSSHPPLVAFAERLLAKLKNATVPETTAENA